MALNYLSCFYFRDSQQVTLSFGGITVDSDSSTAASIVGQPKVEYQVSVRDGDDSTSPPLKRSLAVGDKVVSQRSVWHVIMPSPVTSSLVGAAPLADTGTGGRS